MSDNWQGQGEGTGGNTGGVRCCPKKSLTIDFEGTNDQLYHLGRKPIGVYGKHREFVDVGG